MPPAKSTAGVDVDQAAQEWVKILLTTILAIQLDSEMGAEIIFTAGSPYMKVDPAFSLAAITVCGMVCEVAEVGPDAIRAMMGAVSTDDEEETEI